MPNPYYNPYWLDTDSLEHYGVKGQSWGEKNGPPYPLSRGKDGRVTQTQKKKKQSLIARAKANRRKKVMAKQRAKKAAETKKRKAKEAEENLSKEELREKLLKSTDPKFLSKHIDLLSTNEINDRLKRIEAEQKVKDLLKDDKTKKDVDRGMKFATELAKNVSTIATATSNAAKAYNDIIDATGKREKNEDDRAKRKAEIATAQNIAKASERSISNSSKAMSDLVKEYGQDASAFGNIQMEFDAKTGKLTFKPVGGEGKKKKKK